MGWFGDLCSNIGSAISSACNAVAGAVQSLGSALVSGVTGILQVAGSFLGEIGAVAKSIGVALGFFKPKDNLDELGFRAMYSDKTIEEFESTEAYIDHLRDNVKMDRIKFNSMKEVEKMACRATAVGITSRGIKEKTGVEVPPQFWAEIGRHKFSSDLTMKIVDAFKSGNNLSDFCGYLRNDDLSLDAKLAAGEKIRNIVALENPKLNQNAVADVVQDMCAASRKG